MTQPLEAAARAAHEAQWEEAFPREGTIEHALALQIATAVIRAIREPSEEMIEAMAETPGMKAISAAATIHQLRGYPIDPAAMESGSPLAQAWRAGLDTITGAEK